MHGDLNGQKEQVGPTPHDRNQGSGQRQPIVGPRKRQVVPSLSYLKFVFSLCFCSCNLEETWALQHRVKQVAPPAC